MNLFLIYIKEFKKIHNIMSIKSFNLYFLNEFDYQDPATFEDVEGIDVSLTNMRKAIKISIGTEEVLLTKENAIKISNAIQQALKKMS